MYYLFLSKDKKELFKEEFEKTRDSMDAGKTPVYSEMRGARTMILECLPHYTFQAFFVIIATLLISTFHINETIKVAIVLIVNGICSTLSHSVFVIIKHYFRKRTLVNLGYEVNERNISVLESLEYQSV